MIKTKLHHNQQSEHGFTIVELMIATVVFSIILLLVTSGILQITRTYYKGITSAKTQQTTRSIIDQISQSIQFSGGDIIPTTSASPVPVHQPLAFCIGQDLYSYILDSQLTSNHALVVTKSACTQPITPQPVNSPSVTGTELLGPSMRLSNLVVQLVPGTTNLYNVTVTATYGDDDLLDLTDTYNPKCKILAGGQFCAVSSLSTVVQNRIKSL